MRLWQSVLLAVVLAWLALVIVTSLHGQTPAPTAHPHSSAAIALHNEPGLQWAAAYCDEENPFVVCYNLAGREHKVTPESWKTWAILTLKGPGDRVALVMEDGRVLKQGTDYHFGHEEKPLPPLAPGQKSMAGHVNIDTLVLKTPHTKGQADMVVVFYIGYKTYVPHHTGDPSK